MSDEQKYRITFKCSEHGKFKKITNDKFLEDADCPKCVKQAAKTKLYEIGDGAVSDSDLETREHQRGIISLYHCNDCYCNFKQKTDDLPKEKPPCPKCESANVIWRGTPVTVISDKGKTQNKAIDITAETVMQDYKMTDLRSDVRQGENMAPKLAPKLQAQADSFFGGKGGGKRQTFNQKRIMAQVNSGALRDPGADVVSRLHANKHTVPVHTIASDR